jgi:hypothetical protein
LLGRETTDEDDPEGCVLENEPLLLYDLSLPLRIALNLSDMVGVDRVDSVEN